MSKVQTDKPAHRRKQLAGLFIYRQLTSTKDLRWFTVRKQQTTKKNPIILEQLTQSSPCIKTLQNRVCKASVRTRTLEAPDLRRQRVPKRRGCLRRHTVTHRHTVLQGKDPQHTPPPRLHVLGPIWVESSSAAIQAPSHIRF